MRYKDLKQALFALMSVFPIEKLDAEKEKLVQTAGTPSTDQELRTGARTFLRFGGKRLNRWRRQQLSSEEDTDESSSEAEVRTDHTSRPAGEADFEKAKKQLKRCKELLYTFRLDSAVESEDSLTDGVIDEIALRSADVPTTRQTKLHQELAQVIEVFEIAIESEVERIDAFCKDLVQALLQLKQESGKNLSLLLEEPTIAMHVSLEYVFRLSTQEMEVLSGFANLYTEAAAVERFLLVNIQAVRRIVLKLTDFLESRKHTFLPAAHVKLSSASRKALGRLGRRLQSVQSMRQELSHADGEIMCSSSCYHEYVHDHIRQLETLRFRRKLARFEAGTKHPRLTKATKFLDLESQLRPTQFLSTSVWMVFSTLFLTYLMTYVDKNNTVFSEKGYFISSSIDQAPAANVGTLGLNLSLCLIGIVIFVKHKIVKKQLRGRVWMRTHRLSCGLGIAGVFFGMGVAAFQHQDLPFWHNLCAACFFLFSLFHILMETFVDHWHDLSTIRLGKARTRLAGLTVLGVLGFLIPMAYIISMGPLLGDEFRTRTKFFAAVCELLAFGCLVGWFATYYSTFQEYSFQLHVHRRLVE